MNLLSDKRRTHFSFVRDPEALGCLLREIVAIVNRSQKASLSEVFQYAASLGYAGSDRALRRFLLGKEFVSEHEPRISFCIRAENRNRIDLFFAQYNAQFAPQRLSNHEQYLIFLKEAPAAPFEMIRARMVQLLSALVSDYRALCLLAPGMQTHQGECARMLYLKTDIASTWNARAEESLQTLRGLYRAGYTEYSPEVLKNMKRFAYAQAMLSFAVDQATLQKLEYDASISNNALLPLMMGVGEAIVSLSKHLIETEGTL